jgi:lysyl-tRNA synthetase class 2
MKRLLAAGYPDIYSICRVYRDGESGSRHLPEFTMIEWYRLGFGLDEIANDTTALIAQCLDNPGLAADATRLDYRDAFAEFAGIDVLTASVDELATVACADAALRQSVGDDRDAWLDLLLGDVVAPGFRTDGLTVLRHFPASKAALARLCPADPQFSDRFEVFFGEVELANGYVELTDPELQRDRFERELDVRRSAGRNATPWDPLLIGALEAGLPDCAGVAVGVERLQMLHDNAEDIADVVTFTTGRADG